MFTYEEIYKYLYEEGWTEEDKALARNELANMSNEEWSDWVDYVHDRKAGRVML